MAAERILRHGGCAIGLALTLAIGACRDADRNLVDDPTIAAGVRHELIGNSELARYPIIVDVMGGKVTLEGRVDRSDQRETAEMLAKKVDGVESVSNRILVASSQAEPSSEENRSE